MSPGTWAKAAVLWAVILVLAILNGALREKFLIPAFGTPSGLVISGVSLSVLIVLVSLLAIPWLATSPAGLWTVGGFWLALTLAFEFSFGYFVQHKTLESLFAAYTFEDGNLWPLVLLTTFVAPRLSAALRGAGNPAHPSSTRHTPGPLP